MLESGDVEERIISLNGYLLKNLLSFISHIKWAFTEYSGWGNFKRKFTFSMRRYKNFVGRKVTFLSPRICGILMFIKKEIWI